MGGESQEQSQYANVQGQYGQYGGQQGGPQEGTCDANGKCTCPGNGGQDQDYCLHIPADSPNRKYCEQGRQKTAQKQTPVSKPVPQATSKPDVVKATSQPDVVKASPEP